jgi:amidase/aspartyl-tRNA(Asn)/glutamyl-tRNA(Gln) amidotransferase subunit A
LFFETQPRVATQPENPSASVMTFRDWQQLSPIDAAQALHRRVQSNLAPANRRAAIAWLLPVEQLADSFSKAHRTTPLGGVPWFLKDLFDVKGLPTFAGSTFLPEVRPARSEDAAIVTDFETAGAVLAGKAHLHEFAYGITGENPHYGDCEHPRFPGRTTGGSSSGSAALVAAGVVPLAVGTDTGGSVRLPAAFCGLYGLRLTPGDRWIRDAFPLARSFDTAGWFTANKEDMLVTLSVLLGIPQPAKAPRGCYLELPELDGDVALACREAALKFTSLADALTQGSLLAAFSSSSENYNQIVAAEAWETHRHWVSAYRARYDPGVWQRLQRGMALVPADFAQAREKQTETRAVWAEYFRSFDFLVLPASPFAALEKSECTLANRNRILTLTAPASLGGLPVLTIPVSLPSGLTTGLQIVVPDQQSGVLKWLLQ